MVNKEIGLYQIMIGVIVGAVLTYVVKDTIGDIAAVTMIGGLLVGLVVGWYLRGFITDSKTLSILETKISGIGVKNEGKKME